MLERVMSEGGVVVGWGERRAVLWDCKREALRGLGVNTRDSRGKTTRNSYKLGNSANSYKFKPLDPRPILKPLIIGTQGAVAGI